MTIYILTCINECSELVYAQAFKEFNEAQKSMDASFIVEKNDFGIRGRLEYANLGTTSASLGNEEYCYVWNITEAEL